MLPHISYTTDILGMLRNQTGSGETKMVAFKSKVCRQYIISLRVANPILSHVRWYD